MSKLGYRKLDRELGIYQNEKSRNYLAVRKVDGKAF